MGRADGDFKGKFMSSADQVPHLGLMVQKRGGTLLSVLVMGAVKLPCSRIFSKTNPRFQKNPLPVPWQPKHMDRDRPGSDRRDPFQAKQNRSVLFCSGSIESYSGWRLEIFCRKLGPDHPGLPGLFLKRDQPLVIFLE